jgi:Spy/CpxP family protein refolding chaperone
MSNESQQVQVTQDNVLTPEQQQEVIKNMGHIFCGLQTW